MGALSSRINARKVEFSVETLTNQALLDFQREFEKDYMADWGSPDIKRYADIRNKVVNAMRNDNTMSLQDAWDMAYSLMVSK